MNVLQVNFFDVKGGAARIAWDLSRAYRHRAHGSLLAVGRKLSDDPAVVEIPNDSLRNGWSSFWRSTERALVNARLRLLPGAARLLAHLGEMRRWREQRQGVEDFNFPGTTSLLDLAPLRPDILHAHVLHSGYFDLRALPHLTGRIPTVMTLHDEWTMTGHCACTLGCERWQTGCGQCPDLGIYPAVRRDATAFNWRRKQEIYGRSRLYLVTPCEWLMRRARSSMMQPAIADARVIPNGVDVALFSPGDRKAARRELGLDEDAWISLFVGHGIKSNRFKDVRTLTGTLAELGHRQGSRRQVLVCLGEEGEPIAIGQGVVHFVGYQADLHRVAQYYRAADVYLHASRADTFPTAILEAFACGTPVIATSVGGIPEQVEEGVTGFLVCPGDSAGMAAKLNCLQENRQLHVEMGLNAAAAARTRFSLDIMADRYLRWYDEILARHAAGQSSGVGKGVS